MNVSSKATHIVLRRAVTTGRSAGAFLAAFAILVVAACVSAGGTPAPDQTSTPGGQPTAGGGGGGTAILEAARDAATHACDLLPTDLVATIVPSPTPPQEELYPARCSVYSDTVAIAFSLDVFSKLEKPAGSEEVSGFPDNAYLERLSAGNWTLWVALTPDVGSLFVEVNNQDGADHKDEVVNLAKAILEKLGG